MTPFRQLAAIYAKSLAAGMWGLLVLSPWLLQQTDAFGILHMLRMIYLDGASSNKCGMRFRIC
jgi:hypothetical protein